MNKEKSLITLAEENNASPSMKEALKILDKWKRIDLAEEQGWYKRLLE
jgi:hypothetical protein